MYTLWKELVPPTAVEHAITAVVTAPHDPLPNLVLCRDSILQIYSLQERDELEIDADKGNDDAQPHPAADVNEESGGAYIKLLPKNTRRTARLILVHERRLHGVVAALAAIRTASSARYGRDSLLVGFKDAKASHIATMALLEWCPDTHTLVTVSIHHYENDAYRREFLDNPLPLQIVVEPNHRCAVMSIYGTHLAILPFRQDMNMHGGTSASASSSSKWPYSASWVVPLADIIPDMRNLLALSFLNNFYEPTLSLLYESGETWAGRLTDKKDTCEMVVVSVDLINRKFPVIYRREHLPYDAHSIVSVPAPVGGSLVLANASIIYVDQGTPGVGMALNEYTAEVTAFPHMNTVMATRLNIGLDGARVVAFLSPVRALLALASGELYLVELVQDGRSITDIRVGKVGASVLASSGCRLGDKYLFLGSRMADALLIHYSEAKDNKEQRILYNFRVCDSLPVIGSIMGMTAIRSVTNMEEKREDRRLDIVMSTGYGKNGHLSILRKSIRPADISEFGLPGCRAMWTLRCQREKASHLVEEAYDRFLLISRDTSTMILETGDELQEMETGDFNTSRPTVAAASILQDTHIVQVDATAARLLNSEAKLVQLLPLSDERLMSRVVSAQIVDPYILLVTNIGRFSILHADSVASELKLCQQFTLVKDRRVICGCICSDATGQWKQWQDVTTTTTTASKATPDQATSIKQTSNVGSNINEESNEHHRAMVNGDRTEMDDVDMELYGHHTTSDNTMMHGSDGDGIKANGVDASEEDNDASTSMDQMADALATSAQKTYWCLLYLEDGSLEILSLPSMTSVMTVSRFDLAPATLVDALLDPNEVVSNAWPDAGSQLQELLAVHLGPHQQSMHLMAINHHGEVLAYRPFPVHFHEATEKTRHRLALRFHRIAVGSRFDGTSTEPSASQTPADLVNLSMPLESLTAASHAEHDRDKPRLQRLVPFHNVSGWSGVFLVDQQHPAWIIYTPHHCLNMYPAQSSSVDSFTPFHNIHCSYGFLYYSQQTLHISQLPDGWVYDLPWPLRKVPLHRTIHHIATHPATEMMAVATSTAASFHLKDEPISAYLPMKQDVQPVVGAYALELFTPVTWEQIDRYEFDENERVLCMKCTTLATNQTVSGQGEFVVVGTGYIWGEDISTKGRVYIFDVMEVVPEPDRPQKNHKLKLRCKEEVNGAVTVVDGIRGFLLTSVGRQMVLQDFEETERLNGIGFLDTQIYLRSIACMKHLMLLGDLCKGVWFVGFQEEPPRVILLGKDTAALSVTCNEFIVDGSTVYFAVADEDGSMHLYSYSPYNVQSFNGQRLIRRGDIVVGAPVRTMFRLPLADQHNKVVRTLCLCGLENGTVGVLKPVSDKPYKRMQLLGARLIHGLQHLAGLNPKAYRTLSMKHRMAYNPVRSILDGDLLAMYTQLPLIRRREMAKQARTTDKQLMADLSDELSWPDTIF
ncbi:CPSF A subunit region-domain-containing protein [Syncephalis pseudoplumigaleata]|uniref:CPSF A subunit region-domain-containing protein n=1 Tax=Syncephalis pseudoplumigaleata TaxID=1712513 RepID=A0A4P9Z2P2_9FUNG|nr:CPSF A subunit region-domain-containing protein [Syncephalis pseudoplumigaleata]|eukprot:RKP26676.1 CPSF A subunit region-domain-containing protein [Syncephalis pseudoplumigaleata]